MIPVQCRAAIRVSTTFGLPQTFELIVEGVRHRCNVVWRTDNNIGVTFEFEVRQKIAALGHCLGVHVHKTRALAIHALCDANLRRKQRGVFVWPSAALRARYAANAGSQFLDFGRH